MGVYKRRYRDQKDVLRTSRFWYCTDPATGAPRSLHVTGQRVAEMMLGDLVRAHELRAAGCDTFEETRRAKPLDLLESYVREKSRQNRVERYIADTETRLKAFLVRVDSVADLTPTRVEALLPAIVDDAETARRKARPGAPRHRMGARTQNGYLAALRTFFRWLIRTKRWGVNPIDAVERVKVKGPETERWSLTREQLTALVDPDHVPIWRSVCYLLAATTGLRRGELRTLREADVDLAAATVRARARMTKNSDDETLPLPEWTVELVRAYLAVVPPSFVPCARGRRVGPRGARLLINVPAVPTLRRDLKRVGISATNAAGDVFDFHSLRVSTATILAVEGVGLQLVSRIMRHSDVRLTQAIYTRLVLHDTRAAVAAFRPVRPEPVQETAGDGVGCRRNVVETVENVESAGEGLSPGRRYREAT
ncbi:MAG TPA: site-specific integrase [Terriglobales bacterium]|nr:site-specific integrase [Terriglobales bacterium]